MKVYYFGCYTGQGSGHFWQGVPKAVAGVWNAPTDTPKIIHKHIDGEFLEPRGEGRATLTYVNDWTVLSFQDNSEDKRPGCHSTFVIEGERLTFDQALEAAKQRFPHVFARFKFQVTA